MSFQSNSFVIFIFTILPVTYPDKQCATRRIKLDDWETLVTLCGGEDTRTLLNETLMGCTVPIGSRPPLGVYDKHGITSINCVQVHSPNCESKKFRFIEQSVKCKDPEKTNNVLADPYWWRYPAYGMFWNFCFTVFLAGPIGRFLERVAISRQIHQKAKETQRFAKDFYKGDIVPNRRPQRVSKSGYPLHFDHNVTPSESSKKTTRSSTPTGSAGDRTNRITRGFDVTRPPPEKGDFRRKNVSLDSLQRSDSARSLNAAKRARETPVDPPHESLARRMSRRLSNPFRSRDEHAPAMNSGYSSDSYPTSGPTRAKYQHSHQNSDSQKTGSDWRHYNDMVHVRGQAFRKRS